MNGFEKYLQTHKKGLVKEVTPNTAMWSNIQHELKKERQQKKRYFYAIAASVAILCVVAGSIWFSPNQQETLPLSAYSETYGNIEKALIEDVDYKSAQVANIMVANNYSHVNKSFNAGIKKLDAAYINYKHIVESNGCDDVIMQLIIENYERKLLLLELMYDELNKIHSYENA